MTRTELENTINELMFLLYEVKKNKREIKEYLIEYNILRFRMEIELYYKGFIKLTIRDQLKLFNKEDTTLIYTCSILDKKLHGAIFIPSHGLIDSKKDITIFFDTFYDIVKDDIENFIPFIQELLIRFI